MDDVERRLARVRPAGPPAELRDWIVGGGRSPRSTLREWLLPLAAAAAAVILYALAGRARAAAIPDVPDDPARDAVLQAVSDQLGGGPLARRVASSVIRAEMLQEMRIE